MEDETQLDPKTGNTGEDSLANASKKLGDIIKMLGDDENISASEYEKFVLALTQQQSLPSGDVNAKIDPKVKAVLNMGYSDGDMKDEVVNVSQKTISVRDLIPTQSQIGLLDSLGYLAFECDSSKQSKGIPSYVQGKPDFGGGRIVTANGKYIIDGHHRWSGAFIINPDSTIDTFDLDFSNFNDPEKMLATVQLAIASEYGKLLLKVANSESDIFNYGGSMEELVKKVLRGDFGLPKGGKKGEWQNAITYIQILGNALNGYEGTPELDVQTFEKGDGKKAPVEFQAKVDNLLEENPFVVKTLTDNAELILAKKPADAPKRTVMPQPKDSAEQSGGSATDLPKEIENKLKSGMLNFEVPYTAENNKWIKTYEQFRNKK